MTAWVALGLLGTTVAHSQEDGRAERLSELRSEVEALQHEVTMNKGDMRTRLQALEAARTDLELKIRQEELRLQQLAIEIDKERAVASDEGAATDVLIPSIEAGAVAIKPVIEGGIPFRVSERLAAVDEIMNALTAGTLPAHKAANRLWTLYEDEIRLGRENAMDRQTILLDGQEVLVDVAKVGMVSLFFRAPDGGTGWAERSSGGWAWVRATDRADDRRILEVFDALEKQIRVGWFEVPNVLPELQ
ncbi:MAG: DUF3450 domain-containing protein [Myxococcales bacterium]|nr:DUF3450 domain-containing protein [Myxococcales bacterium]